MYLQFHFLIENFLYNEKVKFMRNSSIKLRKIKILNVPCRLFSKQKVHRKTPTPSRKIFRTSQMIPDALKCMVYLLHSKLECVIFKHKLVITFK